MGLWVEEHSSRHVSLGFTLLLLVSWPPDCEPPYNPLHTGLYTLERQAQWNVQCYTYICPDRYLIPKCAQCLSYQLPKTHLASPLTKYSIYPHVCMWHICSRSIVCSIQCILERQRKNEVFLQHTFTTPFTQLTWCTDIHSKCTHWPIQWRQ